MTHLEQAGEIIKILAASDRQIKEETWSRIIDLADKLNKKPAPATKEEKSLFDEFRVAYRKAGGSVKGLDSEMKHLTKHRDWRDVLPTLHDNFMRQRRELRAKADSGAFVPEWPMLQTYLHQRRWEQVYFNREHEEVPEHPYVSWLRARNYGIAFDTVLKYKMDFKDFDDYMPCNGTWRGLSKVWSESDRRSQFAALHDSYFCNTYLQVKFATVTDFIKSKAFKDD